MAPIAITQASPIKEPFSRIKLSIDEPDTTSTVLSKTEPPSRDVPSPVGDPHKLPQFGATTLTSPTAPILYLPPLLSSLPKGYSHTFPASNGDKNARPLNTETRLPDIDPASLALHKALHHFRPTTAEYSVTPYEQAFNWTELQLPEDQEREWYCVVFRSKRKAGSDGGRELLSCLPTETIY